MIQIFNNSLINRRNENQDRLSCIEIRSQSGASIWSLALADGMGGEAEGSAYATETVLAVQRCAADMMCRAEQLRTETPSYTIAKAIKETLNASVKGLFERVDRMVLSELETKGISGGGSTGCACFIVENEVWTANTGDSPIYLLRAETGECIELSERHNRAEQGVREGRITRECDEYKGLSRRLYSFVGMGEEILTYTSSAVLKDGDILLIGSDGAFGDMVAEEQVASFIHPIRSASMICERLFETSAQSTSDNQTLIVAEYHDENERSSRGGLLGSIFGGRKYER